MKIITILILEVYCTYTCIYIYIYIIKIQKVYFPEHLFCIYLKCLQILNCKQFCKEPQVHQKQERLLVAKNVACHVKDTRKDNVVAIAVNYILHYKISYNSIKRFSLYLYLYIIFIFIRHVSTVSCHCQKCYIYRVD